MNFIKHMYTKSMLTFNNKSFDPQLLLLKLRSQSGKKIDFSNSKRESRLKLRSLNKTKT